MKVSERNLTVLDRDADPEFYFKNLTDGELIEIIEILNDFDDVSSALTELSARDKCDEVKEYSLNILKQNLGDEFLQATAFNLLYEYDVEKAIEIIEMRKSDAPPSLLGEIMNNLASNGSQPSDDFPPAELLQSVADRFSDFSGEDQDRIADDFEYFKEKYKNKFF